MKPANNSSGQTLLVILVTLAAVVTVVLSVVSRSITDIRTTSKEEEATRAFSAAEAGVEKALISTSGVATLSDSGELSQATFNANVSNFAQGQSFFNHPQDLNSGDSATLWFVSHDNNGNLACSSPTLPCYTGTSMRLCWNLEDTNSALEVSVYYDPDANGNYDNVAVARAAIDPDAARRAVNFFDPPTGGACAIDGKNYAYSTTVNFSSLGIPPIAYSNPNGLLMANIRMLYNENVDNFGVDVTGGGLLPGQGKRIESTGVSGESTRKVEVYTLFSEPPNVFQSAVFSQGGITK